MWLRLGSRDREVLFIVLQWCGQWCEEHRFVGRLGSRDREVLFIVLHWCGQWCEEHRFVGRAWRHEEDIWAHDGHGSSGLDENARCTIRDFSSSLNINPVIKMMENDMGGARDTWHVWGRWEVQIGFWWGNLRESEHLENLSVVGDNIKTNL